MRISACKVVCASQAIGFAALIAVLGTFDAQAKKDPQQREHVSVSYNVAFSSPSDWKLLKPVRNEILLVTGRIRGALVGCFVRVSTVPNFRLVKLDDYFARVDEKAFAKLISIAVPDARIHLYDFSTLGGRKARRIIYSGTEDGTKNGNLVHQTIDGDNIVTMSCLTEQGKFQLVYNELDAIAASFRFLASAGK